MKRLFFGLIILTLISSNSNANAKPKNHEFEANVVDVRLTTPLLEKGYTLDQTVRTSARGVIFDRPKTYNLKQPWEKSRSTPLLSIVNYFRSYASGPTMESLEFWHDDSREKLKQFIGLPAVNEAAKKMKTLVLLGVLEIGDTRVVLVNNQDAFVTGWTLKKVSNSWLLSNVPIDDLKIAIIEAALSKSNHLIKRTK